VYYLFASAPLSSWGLYQAPGRQQGRHQYNEKRLVRANHPLPAAAQAEKLAERADARRRLPSAEEAEGRGDYLSCAVIKAGPG
jgi:hypothetical protein